MLDNSLDAVLLLYAITRIGAVSVPVNTSFKGEFLQHQLADAGAVVLIAEGDYAERIIAIASRLSDAQILLYRGNTPSQTSKLDLRPLASVRLAGSNDVDVDVEPSDLAMLIYTSGTTGPSKGCMVPHNYICNMARQVVESFGIGENDVFWTPLPLFHANAIACAALGSVLAGARCAIAPRFSVSGFWPEIERTGATVISLIGSIATLVANAPRTEAEGRCFGQIRNVAAAPLPEAIKAVWKERFGVKNAGAPGYGLTEMCMLTMTKLGDFAPPGTSGQVIADYDLRILAHNETECEPGTPGEIVVRPRRSDLMFQGYWRRPESTLAVIKDLWFHTGDIGKLDEHGFLTFVDRKKDYLRRGGENISSFEMEATFLAHPAVEDVAVHAVPSDLSEDEVKVTVVLKPGHQTSIDAEGLCRWSIDLVPHFAVPRYIEIVSDLPRNPVGKVRKDLLREAGVTSNTWDRSKSSIVVERRG